VNATAPSLPNLELLGKLGEGGMSTVWKACNLLTGEIVAVKILNREFTASAEDIALFKSEAKTMSEICHPGIVRSHDINCHEGVWYYTMEYVDGYNFNALLVRKQHLCEADCLLICESIAVALDYAWNEFGVVHCDIKPDNIMINTDGIVKLTDLGLCHTFQYLKDGMKEIPDHVMGTPAYISPEQVYGDTEPDCRADIYSLAASLYHLSTGRMLFPGLSNEDMMRAHCDEMSQAKDPRIYRPELSEGFCQLLEAMLVKNRDYRLPSWKDVCEMCLAVEQGVAFKPRKGPASSLSLAMSAIMSDAEDNEPIAQMQVPEPKKRVTRLFLGGKAKHEPQITVDPESGKKILQRQKLKQKVNAGFKINKPVDW
jgi:serine/threonine-protein kinase